MPLGKGTFLIGSPEVERGLYSRSVLLLCEHNVTGSFGLIINKLLDVDFPEELVSIQGSSNPNIQVISGGLIQPNQMLLLHSSPEVPDQTLEICDGVFLGGDLEFLQKQIAEPQGPKIRLCFGYSAWGAGQLEKEILAGAWFVHPASAEYVFNTPPESVWRSILQGMGGKYANMASIPEDLSLN
jgi:putative transcriptional regulator